MMQFGAILMERGLGSDQIDAIDDIVVSLYIGILTKATILSTNQWIINDGAAEAVESSIKWRSEEVRSRSW